MEVGQISYNLLSQEWADTLELMIQESDKEASQVVPELEVDA